MVPVRVACALADPDECEAIEKVLKAGLPGCSVLFPSSIAEVERLHSGDSADVLVTDFGFQGGGLADWLVLWPIPAVLIADPDVSSERMEQALKEESSLFIERRADGGHVKRMPLLVRKALGIRESINRQNAHLRISERRYLDLVQAIPDIVYSLDGKGRFTYLNDAARELGLEPALLIGKHFSEILDPIEAEAVCRDRVLEPLRGTVTGEELAPKLFDERRTGHRMTRNLELRLKLRGREDRFGAVFAYGEVSSAGFDWPEFAEDGIGTVGIIRDITLRKRHEKELEELLAVRERLLSELHHRVRNNLQLICSLMHLEESAIGNLHDRGIFVRARAQVEAMAFVHDLFCDPESLEHVDMGVFGSRLVENLAEIYETQARNIRLAAETEGLELDLESAVTLALLANELVTQSLMRSYPAAGGSVSLRVSSGETECQLTLRDDGEEDDEGLRDGGDLVEALVSQLKGRLAISPGENGRGRLVSFNFPRKEPPATSCG